MKYTFRGHLIFNYDPNTKELTTDMIHSIPTINYCNFITEDYHLFEQFFHAINMHRNDDTYPLKDIIVD